MLRLTDPLQPSGTYQNDFTSATGKDVAFNSRRSKASKRPAGRSVRDDTLMEGIRTAWDPFQQCQDGDTPPSLTDADTVVRSDAIWSAAATAYNAAKHAAEAHAERLNAANAALVALVAHPRESGAGVSVTRFWKAGNVDYTRVPELGGVDLNGYRGKSREEVRITQN